MKEVARLAGVSTATVSRALERPELVSEETRRKVADAVASAGYKPNLLARNLRKMEARSIIVIVPDVSNPFFSEVIHGIETAAHRAGYSVLLGNTENDPARERAYGELIDDRRADGMILLNGRLPFRTRLAGAELPPLVMACEYLSDQDVPTVRIDNIEGARRAVMHLLGLGHRRIGHVTGPMWNVLSRDRLQGYRDTLIDHGLPYAEALVQPGDFSIGSGAAAGHALLSLPEPPTAIFAANDEMAMGVLRAARERGVAVPEALSLVGFDDIRFAAYVDPPLTTVAQPCRRIGEQAMAMLGALLSSEPPEERRVVLEAELVVRRSTAPAPAGR
ncbi:MAG TPA: LacI family DNA-binding transcriptional regulator [Alphaproteobacteria bacterium]|nr:LacI family DNA-binding transcriptional regulator [Alphaproteobacteria bacterium]